MFRQARRNRLTIVLVSLAALSCRTDNSMNRPHLDSLGGYVELEAEAWDEARNGTEQKERILRETVALFAKGDYYHSKLLEYDARVEFGLEQQDIESSGGATTSRSLEGDNTFFDIRGLMFKDLPYSVGAYTMRSKTRTRQSFFNTTEALLTETGADVHAKKWWIPSQLHFDHHEYEGRGFDTHREDRDTLRIDGTRLEDAAQYTYAASWNDIRLSSSSQEFEDVNVNASSSNLFGDDKLDRWFNNVNVREQTGTVDSHNQGATSSYFKHWSDTWSSTHEAQYGYNESPGFSTETTSLSSGVGHRLFDSLVSNLSARVGRSDFGGGAIDSYGSTLQLNYTRRTPVGTLSVRQLTDAYVQDQDDLQGSVPAIDEAHVVAAGAPIFLANQNVDLPTIVVTDATGLVVYVLGLDFLTSQQGSLARIDIPIGSNIAAGQTILVDYSFFPNPAIRFRSVSNTTHVGFQYLDWADVRLGLSDVDQDLLEGTDNGLIQDSQRTSAGLRVFHWGATLGAEYERWASDILPFERTSGFASYQRTLLENVFWSVQADVFHTRFSDQAESENGVSASTSVYANMGTNLRWDLRGEWHDIDYRTDSGTGVMMEASLNRRFRAVEGSLGLRYSDEEFDVATDQRIAAFLFSIRRRF